MDLSVSLNPKAVLLVWNLNDVIPIHGISGSRNSEKTAPLNPEIEDLANHYSWRDIYRVYPHRPGNHLNS
jgi:hypothetical protein